MRWCQVIEDTTDLVVFEGDWEACFNFIVDQDIDSFCIEAKEHYYD